MTDFMSIFQPGLEYTRRQKDLEKILVVEEDEGAPGPRPLDLESGVVTITMPAKEPDGGSPSAD